MDIIMTGQHAVCGYCGKRIEQDEFGGWSATHSVYNSSTYLCPDAPVTPDSGTGMHAPKDTEHIVAADSAAAQDADPLSMHWAATTGTKPAREAYGSSYTVTVRTPASEATLRAFLEGSGFCVVDDITWNR